MAIVIQGLVPGVAGCSSHACSVGQSSVCTAAESTDLRNRLLQAIRSCHELLHGSLQLLLLPWRLHMPIISADRSGLLDSCQRRKAISQAS